MQSQFVCGGCRTVLLYPSGARNICCTICNMVTSVPPPGMEMARLICRGCRTRLMHARGATSVRCSCCNTINLVPAATPPNPNNVAHIKCENCQTMLMYHAGALLVICTICQFTTNAMGHSHNQTVVIKNPWTIDESGRLVHIPYYLLNLKEYNWKTSTNSYYSQLDSSSNNWRIKAYRLIYDK